MKVGKVVGDGVSSNRIHERVNSIPRIAAADNVALAEVFGMLQAFLLGSPVVVVVVVVHFHFLVSMERGGLMGFMPGSK